MKYSVFQFRATNIHQGEFVEMPLTIIAHNAEQALNIFLDEIYSDPEFEVEIQPSVFATFIGDIEETELDLFIRYSLNVNTILVYPTIHTSKLSTKELYHKSSFLRQAIELLNDLEEISVLDTEVKDMVDKVKDAINNNSESTLLN